MSPFDSPRGHEPADMAATRLVRAHLQHALLCLARGDVAGARAAARLAADAGPEEGPDGRGLVVDADGRGYVLGGRRVSLARRGNLRRIVLALAEQAVAAPGVALTRDEVLAAGWPGERMKAESGALRVYTAIRRLRSTGLEGILVTRDDGYLLDPSARTRIAR